MRDYKEAQADLALNRRGFTRLSGVPPVAMTTCLRCTVLRSFRHFIAPFSQLLAQFYRGPI